MKFRLGSRVKMNNFALENYGKEYKDVVFVVTHTANCLAQHPGYDSSVSPDGLYDLKFEKTGESLGSSLYDWELKGVFK